MQNLYTVPTVLQLNTSLGIKQQLCKLVSKLSFTLIANTMLFLCSFSLLLLCMIECYYYSRSKSSEGTNEGAFIVRILELFCETFNVPFGQIEDKLPLVLLTHSVQK